MIQDSKAEGTASAYRGSKWVSLEEMKEFFSGQWFWFWSLGLLTQLVPAPIWRCCLPAPHSICPLHTHLATFLDLAASWQSVVHLDRPPTCVSSAPHLASTSDSLAMRSLSELPSGIHRDGTPCCGALPFWDLGAQITAPAPACPYPLAPIQGIGDQRWGSSSPLPPTPSFINPSQPKCHRGQQPDCCTYPNTTTARLPQRPAQALLPLESWDKQTTTVPRTEAHGNSLPGGP